MTEAMQMVRDALGEDAIIVATREENGGRSVRVTAAVERMDESNGFGPRGFEDNGIKPRLPKREVQAGVPDDYLQYDAEEDAEDAVQEKLTDTLLRHGVPGDICDSIISTATMMGLNDTHSAMKMALEHAFRFAPMPMKSPRKSMMLIGAPGAGKTLATAKLAARAALTGLKPAVITTDTVRAGGVEQLEAFTKLLQIPLLKARSPSELRARLAETPDADITFIDTGGCNPFEVDDMRLAAGLMEAGTIEPVLVMAAGGDAEESAEVARCFAVLGVQRLFPTRLDVARRFGGLLSAAGRSGIAFSDASNTPMVASGLITLSAQSLSTLLLPRDERQKKTVTNTNNNRGAAQNVSTKNLRQTG